MGLYENVVHSEILENRRVQMDINNILNIDNVTFKHEDRYINGIIADFSLISNGNIEAIIECKGGRINVTDYVRGIGQVFQYEYFYENGISPRGYEYSNKFNTVLICPSSIFRNRDFNIGKFKYPKTLKILELNEETKAIREVTKPELNKLKDQEIESLITISQYYIRDNRMYELYILLKYTSHLKSLGRSSCSRSKSELHFLRKLGTHNNRNWRNAFISLSSLGLINHHNIPTEAGFLLASKNYEEFAYEMYSGYLKPYFEELFIALNKISNYNYFNNYVITNSHLCGVIKENYRNKDILFLTQSDGRYISSWLNILRDDYGCINFVSRSNNRKIIYNPTILNKQALISNIKTYSVADRHIEKYYKLLRTERLLF